MDEWNGGLLQAVSLVFSMKIARLTAEFDFEAGNLSRPFAFDPVIEEVRGWMTWMKATC